MAKNAPGPLQKKLIATVSDIERATEATRGIVPANSMVLVLASVGTQLAAFTHEVNALLSLASDVEGVAVKLREAELPAKLRGQVVKVGTAAADLRRASGEASGISCRHSDARCSSASFPSAD